MPRVSKPSEETVFQQGKRWSSLLSSASCVGFGSLVTDSISRELFRTQDISRIKDYCITQWSKLLEGKVSIQDFTLAKEVKLGSYSYVIHRLILSVTDPRSGNEVLHRQASWSQAENLQKIRELKPSTGNVYPT